jgi:hypothetical protein
MMWFLPFYLKTHDSSRREVVGRVIIGQNRYKQKKDKWGVYTFVVIICKMQGSFIRIK